MDFDVLASHDASARHAFYIYARRERPAILQTEPERVVSLFRHADIRSVLLDSDTYRQMPFGQLNSLLNTDPPDHTRLRASVARAMTPGAVKRLRGRMEEVAEACLSEALEVGEVDLVESFSWRLPETVLLEWIGFSSGARDTVQDWQKRFIEPYDRAENLSGEFSMPGDDALTEISAYFGPLVEARRCEPREDLLTQLVVAHDEGRLDQRELVATAFLMVLAGQDAASALISSVLWELGREPSIEQQLRSDPSLLDLAIEEFIRFSGPFRYADRKVARPVRVGDLDLEPGDTVLAWLDSANRDEDVFADPQRLDIRRRPNPHMGFGLGAHSCPGSHFARLFTRVALEVLFRRTRRVEVQSEVELIEAPLINGPSRLTARLIAA